MIFLVFSFLECASLCAINSNCLALYFDKSGSACNLGNGTGLKIQTNQTLWNEAIPVHVKEGVQLETNGNSWLQLDYMRLSSIGYIRKAYVSSSNSSYFISHLVTTIKMSVNNTFCS